MKTHGEVKWINGKRIASPEYRSWQMMKNRCLNMRAKDYKYYGGRGICICKRWLVYELFINDMGRRPTNKHCLERRDVNGNYTKQNCYWATRQQQAQNRNYCKISLKLAAKIRRFYQTGKGNQYELARRFKVTQATISQIIRGCSWKNAEGKRVFRSQAYRNVAGDNNANAKINSAQAILIKTLYATGKHRQLDLANRFDISQSQISKIILGQSR